MTEITVYGAPKCSKCKMTEAALTRKGIAFKKVDVSTDEAAMDHVRSLGHRSLPVVVAGETHWSDFRPDQIDALHQTLTAARTAPVISDRLCA